MSRSDENAGEFRRLARDLLVATRGWTFLWDSPHGDTMQAPGGAHHLVVTRAYPSRTAQPALLENAARYAAHRSEDHAGAVLAVLATVDARGMARIEPWLCHGLDVVDETMVAAMAGMVGADALDRYARILREQGFGRPMLAQERWWRPEVAA